MSAALCALCGAATGLVEVVLLARAASKRPSYVSALVRVVVVAAVLLLALRAGHLGSGVAGWVAGFFPGAVVVHQRLR